MPVFDECCVLIPVSTLEDFPSDLSDYDARSLLAAWTVLWHPRLLAQTTQIPTWHRADAPPEPIGKRLFTAPNPSVNMLPDGYQLRAQQTEEACWVTGNSRDEMLDKLNLEPCPPLTDGSRTVTEQDFFAAAYASLQIQVMTRRLRYTSNLDEIHLQNRLVAAAKAFIDGQAEESIAALHDVFDCLAEERDHYFSSDPHLIDLVLTSESTLDSLLQLASQTATENTTPNQDADSEIKQVPTNILVDVDLCRVLAQSSDPRVDTLKDLLKCETMGWAGGGPADNICLDAMTLSQAESTFIDCHRQIEQSIGITPAVYGRFAGTTPSDLTPTLARIGYCGMIPIDFAGGRGFGDEAKVIMQSAAGDLEALTAKPIDAASDAAFLNLGAKLGEAIDSGEIATALLAHWPGKACDSFADLQCIASWSLSLGRFWTLADYFREGEHPYHNGNLSASSPDAAEWLSTLIASGTPQPIEAAAEKFRHELIAEQNKLLVGMARLTSGKTDSPKTDVSGTEPPAPGTDLARAMGFTLSETTQEGDSRDSDILLLNPHSNGLRTRVTASGNPPPKAEHIFAASQEGNVTETTVDIPACGFVLLRQSDSKNNPRGGIGARLRKSLLGGVKPIADERSLTNEFMEIAISAETGGIAGIYSGGARGNRFSMRLVRCSPLPSDSKKSTPGEETLMRCSGHRIITTNAAIGTIEAKGELIDSNSEAVLANFTLRYSLPRGSRTLMVSGEIDVLHELKGEPWDNYYALRAAVANESSICRALIRDKMHRPGSRRVVSPLGILLDESERQTLICGNGSAFHRRVGNRFLDTLIAVPGDTEAKFNMNYGMDVPNPVNAARELLTGAKQIEVRGSENAPTSGWLLHTSPRDLLVSELKIDRSEDGQLYAMIRLVQTKSQQCKASLRFLRDVESAYMMTGKLEATLEEVLSGKQTSEKSEGSESHEENDAGDTSSNLLPLTCEGDLVSLTMQSHASSEILVVFAANT
jgi:alpha-mannosidase